MTEADKHIQAKLDELEAEINAYAQSLGGEGFRMRSESRKEFVALVRDKGMTIEHVVEQLRPMLKQLVDGKAAQVTTRNPPKKH